jgi:hypothetical protein
MINRPVCQGKRPTARQQMFDSELLRVIVRIGVAAFVIYMIYDLTWGRRADFVVRIKKGLVSYRGKFPEARQNALTHFLVQDLALHGPVTIKGAWNKKQLQIWFGGRLNAGEKQRIRNFFLVRI